MGESFVQLLESVLLYGAEVGKCCMRMEALEQVQLRAARIFLVVGRRHPRVALQYEVMMLPLVWEARRCVGFWVRMMRMEEKRIVRMVALEAWECQNKVKWVEDTLEMFRWSSGVVEKLEGVSLGEVGYMLRDCAWPEVKKAWMMEAEGKPKLGMVKNLIEGGCRARCVQVARKELRQIMAKLIGRTAELSVETGRWIGLVKEYSICGQYGLREVENVKHFVLRCDGLVRERVVLMKKMAELTTGFEERGDEEKVTLVLDEGCRDLKVGKAIEGM